MLGAKIRKHRETANFSVKELAELIKCSEGTIRRYERGERTPTFEYLQLLAKELNVSISDLATEEELEKIKKRTGFDSKLKKTLSQNIVKYRNKKGITQRQLAKKSNISIIALNKYENGMVIPNLEATIKIADALNVSIDELTDRKIEKESNSNIYCKLSERIKSLRIEKGLNQKELAELLDTNSANVRIWEEAFINVTDSLIKIAEFYNVSFDYLFGKTDERGTFKKPTESINVRLKALCTKISYAELGRKLTKYNISVSHAGISRWFKDNVPSTNIIIVLAHIFDVSIDYIIGV